MGAGEQKRPAADKAPSLWAPLAAQARGRLAFLRAWAGAGDVSHSPRLSGWVSLLQVTEARPPAFSPLSSSCGHPPPRPPAQSPPRPVWTAVSSPDHQLPEELSEFRPVPEGEEGKPRQSLVCGIPTGAPGPKCPSGTRACLWGLCPQPGTEHPVSGNWGPRTSSQHGGGRATRQGPRGGRGRPRTPATLICPAESRPRAWGHSRGVLSVC